MGHRLSVVLTCLLALAAMSGCRSSHKVKVGKGDKVEIVVQKRDRGIVDEAMAWIGTPYKYAGSEKGKGTDCSGMVMKVYEDIEGIKLPRNSRKQAEFCKKIRDRDVQPGDLVFFATGKDPDVISHVGIMIDGSQFVHASTKKGVIVSDMFADYYIRTFKMYGRVPGRGESNRR